MIYVFHHEVLEIRSLKPVTKQPGKCQLAHGGICWY
jgi:hypothetical protein